MPSDSGADLDQLAVEAFNRQPLAGLAVGVVRDGELVYERGLGFADVAARRPVTAGTVFRIGSISKTMTAIAVMQLVEQGRLGLDDPVNKHLRGYRVEHRPGAPPVTIGHLLTHTGGLGELRRLTDVARPTIGLGADPAKPPPTLTELYAPVLKAELAPGEKWAYANHGFATLGQLVEDVAGRPFAEHVRATLFEPLGMEHTDFLRSERVRGELAVGYAFGRGRLKPVKDREIVVGPAGSVFSTLRDLSAYAAALMNGGGGVLTAESLAQMWEPQLQISPGVTAMGLAFFLHDFGGHRVVGHDGGWPGFVSALLVAPDDGLAVIAFTNTSAGLPTVLFSTGAMRRLLDVTEPELPRTDVPERPDVWPELTGLYKPHRGLNTNARAWQLLGGEAEVLVRKDHLTLRALSPLPPLRKGLRLHPVDPDEPLRFAVSHAGVTVPVVFERDETGAITSVATGTRFGFLRLYRVPRVRSVRLWGQAVAGAGAAATVTWRARSRRRARGRAARRRR
jgi:CubicO group peptidase (beta-lactamase class C family)